jgi:NADH:ubiquinone reductase (H+-translocating)
MPATHNSAAHAAYEPMQTIVVVGAGFGGLRAALGLAKRFPHPEKTRVILIDRNSYHTYTPSLYEVATAYREGHLRADTATEREFEERLGGSACFSISDVVGRYNITFVHGEVMSINARSNIVQLRGNNDIRFDYCVVALGASVAYFGVAGAQEHCAALKTLSDALRIRERVEELFDNALNEGQCVHIATVGAGLSGFEVVAEMAYYAGHLAHSYGINQNEIELSLIEAGDTILPHAPTTMRRAAAQRLEELGIAVLTGDRIVEVEPQMLHFASGKTAHADLVVWGGGIQGHSVLKNTKGLALDKKGRVVVDRFLHVHGADHIYAIGDNAAYRDEQHDSGAPATAWVAEEQADSVMYNITARLRGLEETPYTLTFPGYISSAGGKHGIAHLYGVTIAGFPAWVLKRMIDLKYILSLYPPAKGFLIWLRELRLFTRND